MRATLLSKKSIQVMHEELDYCIATQQVSFFLISPAKYLKAGSHHIPI